MSAILGFINKKGKSAEPHLLSKMLQALMHRATDGSSVFFSDHVAMGNCRLIVYPQQYYDLQPFQINDLIITSDARIDNRKELAVCFGIDLVQLQHTPDSKLLLLAYQQWGEKCVNHLEGEYAFAIWDKQNQMLFVATDPIGFRSVFYYDSPDIFIFCSEIKGILAAKSTPDYFEEESLIQYYFKQGSPDKTYNKEVFALCGGNILTMKEGRLFIQKYWELQPRDKYHFTKDEDWYDCMRDLLYQSVEKRLNPEVPVGVTLSGGLDSTTIACILSELLVKKNKPLYAFSSVLPLDYKGIESDERQYIEIVGKHCPNILQTYIDATQKDPFSNIEEAFDIEEQFSNPFFYIDRAILEVAREKCVKNLFTGFGGDFLASWKGRSVIYLLLKRGQFREAFHLLRQFSDTGKTSLIREFVVRYLLQTKGYKVLRSLQQVKEINWQITTTLRDDFVKNYRGQLCFEPDPDHVLHVSRLIGNGSLGRIVGRINNRNGFYGMESAMPFFDKVLLEFLSEVPVRLFVEGGYPRNLFRMAIRDIIPREINCRTDKLPYAPGYNQHIINCGDLFEDLMKIPENQYIFDRYIDCQRVQKYLKAVIPVQRLAYSGEIIGIRMAQAYGTVYVLHKLKSNHYFFNSHF